MKKKEQEVQEQITASNKFLIFGQKMDAIDTLTDDEYKDDKTRISGNLKGIARRNPINKALHQTSLMSHTIGELIKNKTNKDVTEDLTPDQLLDGLTQSITDISTDVTNNIINGGGSGGSGGGLPNNLLHKDGTEHVTGLKIFDATPKITTAITDPQHATTKGEVDKITGDLSQLITEDKSSLVNAINEIKEHGGGGSGGGDSGYIVKPSVLKPTTDQTDVLVSFSMKGSPYRTIITDNPRTKRRFEVSTDPNFKENVKFKEVNADEVQFDDLLTESTQYYCRLRDYSSEFSSVWSDTVKFTTGGAITILPPTLSVEGEPDAVGRSPTVKGSSFTLSLGTSDTHEATDWLLYKKNATDRGTEEPIWQSLSDTTNKTSIKIPEGQLITNSDYTIKARYKGTKYGYSEYGQKDFKTKATFNNFSDPQLSDTIPYKDNMKPPFFVHIDPMLDSEGNLSYNVNHSKTEWEIYEEGTSTPIKRKTTDQWKNKLKLLVTQADGLMPKKKYYIKFRCYNAQQSRWSEWQRTETITMASDFTPCFSIKVRAKDNFTINLKNAFGATPVQRPIYDLNKSSIGGGNGCYLFGDIQDLKYTISIDNGSFTNNFDQTLTMTKGQEKIIRIKGDPRYEYRMTPAFFYQDNLDYKEGSGFVVDGVSSYKTKEQIQSEIINNYILFFDSIVELLEPLPPPLIVDHNGGQEDARPTNHRSGFYFSIPLRKSDQNTRIETVRNTRKGFYRNITFSNGTKGCSYFNYNPCFVIPYGYFDSMLMNVNYNLYTKFNILQNVDPNTCHDMYKNSYKDNFHFMLYGGGSDFIKGFQNVVTTFCVKDYNNPLTISDKVFNTLDNRYPRDFAYITKNKLFKDTNCTRLVKNLFQYFTLDGSLNNSYLETFYVEAERGLNIDDLVFKRVDLNSTYFSTFCGINFYKNNSENVTLKEIEKYFLASVNWAYSGQSAYDLSSTSIFEVNYGFNTIDAKCLIQASDYNYVHSTYLNYYLPTFRSGSNLVAIEGDVFSNNCYLSGYHSQLDISFNGIFSNLPLFSGTFDFTFFDNTTKITRALNFARGSGVVSVKLRRSHKWFSEMKKYFTDPSNNNNVNIIEVD